MKDVKNLVDVFTEAGKQNVINEFDIDKNGILPECIEVSAEEIRTKMVWWKCSDCGNSWLDSIESRLYGGQCNQCYAGHKDSFNERSIAFYLKKYVPVMVGYKPEFLDGMELDIYLPTVKLNGCSVAIEYDGPSHEAPSREISDKKKNILCNENGVFLIRVREEGLLPLSENDIVRTSNSQEELNTIIRKILGMLGLNTSDVNVSRDSLAIRKSRKSVNYDKSLYNWCVENDRWDLLQKWDYESNSKGDVTPQTIGYSCSTYHVNWRCEHHGTYMETPAYMTRESNTECPVCAGKLLYPGVNDLITYAREKNMPWLVSEYDAATTGIPASKLPFAYPHKVFWKINGVPASTTIESRTNPNSLFNLASAETAKYARASWMNMLSALVDFCVKEKLVNVHKNPSQITAITLRDWFIEQIEAFKNGELDQKQMAAIFMFESKLSMDGSRHKPVIPKKVRNEIAKLESKFKQSMSDKHQQKWFENYVEARNYFFANGNLNIRPTQKVNNKNIGPWLNRQRAKFNAVELPSICCDMLTAIAMKW